MNALTRRLVLQLLKEIDEAEKDVNAFVPHRIRHLARELRRLLGVKP